jgi:hypothetical protein
MLCALSEGQHKLTSFFYAVFMPEYEPQSFPPNNTFQKFGVSISAARVCNVNMEKQEELLYCLSPNQGG